MDLSSILLTGVLTSTSAESEHARATRLAGLLIRAQALQSDTMRLVKVRDDEITDLQKALKSRPVVVKEVTSTDLPTIFLVGSGALVLGAVIGGLLVLNSQH
jgi:hypothetical protein